MHKDKLVGFSQASVENGGFVEFGYGQVEPNHLSAQRTAQIYAQLPADADINVLEQGQFVKYDYAKGLVNFEGAGEWMLVYNETKLYRDFQMDAEFAMLKDNYVARVYSPLDHDTLNWDKQSRYYGGKLKDGSTEVDWNGEKKPFEKVTAGPDMYELHYNEDPFHFEGRSKEKMMPAGTTMVPRVFKTNVGDIFTTNMVAEAELAVGDVLSPRAADGILCKAGDGSMSWQVVKVYNLADRQKAVKIMRIA
ncbi:MAG: hypothetical protein IKB70_08475 [Bacilli bacterium]|nr:hypothetical protein [Bacilli bacterium]